MSGAGGCNEICDLGHPVALCPAREVLLRIAGIPGKEKAGDESVSGEDSQEKQGRWRTAYPRASRRNLPEKQQPLQAASSVVHDAGCYYPDTCPGTRSPNGLLPTQVCNSCPPIPIYLSIRPSIRCFLQTHCVFRPALTLGKLPFQAPPCPASLLILVISVAPTRPPQESSLGQNEMTVSGARAREAGVLGEPTAPIPAGHPHPVMSHPGLQVPT